MRLLSTLALVFFTVACVEEPTDTPEPDCTEDNNCTDTGPEPEPDPEPEPEPATALSFSGGVSIAEVDSMQRLTHGDVDGDGNPDLVHGYKSELVWHKGDGEGGFSIEEASWTEEVLSQLMAELGDTGEVPISQESLFEFLPELTPR